MNPNENEGLEIERDAADELAEANRRAEETIAAATVRELRDDAIERWVRSREQRAAELRQRIKDAPPTVPAVELDRMFDGHRRACDEAIAGIREQQRRLLVKGVKAYGLFRLALGFFAGLNAALAWTAPGPWSMAIAATAAALCLWRSIAAHRERRRCLAELADAARLKETP